MSSESTEIWTGWYRDRSGAEAIVITADGRHVATRVRGVEYRGEGFAALSAPDEGGRSLTNCVLEWDLPLPVVMDGVSQRATLSCLLTLGERSDLSLTLHYGGAAFEACVAGGDFEGALARVRSQLPPGADFARGLPQTA